MGFRERRIEDMHRAYRLLEFIFRSRKPAFQGCKEEDFFCFRYEMVPHTQIENLRKRLWHSRDLIEVEDFGAGIRKRAEGKAVSKRRISNLAKTSASPVLQGVMLRELVAHSKAGNILELGTSLGIGTMYLAAGNEAATVYTVEGSEAISDIARSHFIRLGFGAQIHCFTGSFEEQLEALLSRIPSPDFVFMDGHHAYEPTLDYFETLLTGIPDSAVIVLDDIRWSREMWRAWKALMKHPRVKASADYYHFGALRIRSVVDPSPRQKHLMLWPAPMMRWLLRY